MTLDADRLRQLAEAAEPQTRFVTPFFVLPGPDVTEVLLIRHAQVPQGSMGEDAPLTGIGVEQAEALADYLASLQIDAVYTSPTNRARQTAGPVAQSHGLEIEVIDDLRDVDNRMPGGVSVLDALKQAFGEEEANRRHELLRKGLSLDLLGDMIESSASLRGRVAVAIDGIIGAHPGGRCAVFSHAPTIAAYVGHVVESPAGFLFYPRLTSITVVLAQGERRQLQLVNATPHFGVL